MKRIVPFLVAETLLAIAFVVSLFVDKTSTISAVASTDNTTWFCLAAATIIAAIWLLTLFNGTSGRPTTYALILAFVVLASLVTIRPDETVLNVHAAFVLLGVLMVVYALFAARSAAMDIAAILIVFLLTGAIVAKTTGHDHLALLLEYPLFGVLLYGLFFL